ncbi:dihydrofolate reductase family protein [Niabella pedocola]|uniref:Dihydrofolate reductase family protein n=1 Tax=Niabella pedocola TaxID=1752077 RepID=A0ABS8PL43_9BACT|nr:dihydrofolate reductase family protein [Niabella pedocola]MCD2421818.1 dihydrofolate reductase family protein [Niabella pedocola]
MKKVVAAMNMTLDGICDHTAGIPDEAMHQHYAELLNDADVALYGRITYQLMEYWRPFVKEPTGEQSMDDFAVAIDRIPKIVFSHTLKHVDWETASLADQEIEQVVSTLKQSGNGNNKNILVCSPSLIVALTKLRLIDEYQLCVHPVIAGDGLPLFKNIHERMVLTLLKTKTFDSGGVILYYKPIKESGTYA